MAKVYTVKIFGNKRRYKKVGNKYFQIMKDGKLNKDSASGAWRLQLENSENSRLVSTPSKTFKNIQSLAKASLNKNKRGQAQASTSKDDGGKAIKDFKRDIGFAKDGGKSGLDKTAPNRNVALKKKALN